MVYVFLPLLIRFRTVSNNPPAPASSRSHKDVLRLAPLLTFGMLFLAGAILFFRGPGFDPSPDVLRPRKSEASEALRVVQEILGTSGDPYWMLVHGLTVQQVREHLRAVDAHLSEHLAAHGIQSVTLPLTIWPDVANQQANAPLLRAIIQDRERISSQILASGFTGDALNLVSTVFSEWERFEMSDAVWPRGRVADWVLPKFVYRPTNRGDKFIALGLVTPTAEFRPADVVPKGLSNDVLLSGWSLLGKSVLRQVKQEVPIISAWSASP